MPKYFAVYISQAYVNTVYISHVYSNTVDTGTKIKCIYATFDATGMRSVVHGKHWKSCDDIQWNDLLK